MALFRQPPEAKRLAGQWKETSRPGSRVRYEDGSSERIPPMRQRKGMREPMPHVREYEDDSREVVPDRSVRPDATRVKPRGTGEPSFLELLRMHFLRGG